MKAQEIKVIACKYGEFVNAEPLVLTDPIATHDGNKSIYLVDMRAFGIDAMLHISVRDLPDK